MRDNGVLDPIAYSASGAGRRIGVSSGGGPLNTVPSPPMWTSARKALEHMCASSIRAVVVGSHRGVQVASMPLGLAPLKAVSLPAVLALRDKD